MYYTWYAERHHWTPEQVDNLPWLMQERLMTVATMQDEARRDKQRGE